MRTDQRSNGPTRTGSAGYLMNGRPGPGKSPVGAEIREVHSPPDVLMRGLAIAGLAGIAIVHLVQLPSTWHETKDLFVLFAFLVVAATAVAVALLFLDGLLVWASAALTAIGPIVGYVVTRSASVFFDHDDVGNWLEPLVLVAVFIEAAVLGIALAMLSRSTGLVRSTQSLLLTN